MQFSARDISILENFTSIYASMSFKKGHVQKTAISGPSLIAVARLDAELDRDFAIYDMSRFLRMLQVVSKGQQHDIELTDTHAIMRGEKTTITYYYCPPANLKGGRSCLPSENDPVMPEIDVEFVLPYVTYTKVIKAATLVGVNHLCAVGRSGKLYLETLDTNKRILDNVSVDIGDADKDFRFVFSLDNMKLLTGDYNVRTCSTKGISHFRGLAGGLNEDVQYWIAMEAPKRR